MDVNPETWVSTEFLVDVEFIHPINVTICTNASIDLH